MSNVIKYVKENLPSNENKKFNLDLDVVALTESQSLGKWFEDKGENETCEHVTETTPICNNIFCLIKPLPYTRRALLLSEQMKLAVVKTQCCLPIMGYMTATMKKRIDIRGDVYDNPNLLQFIKQIAPIVGPFHLSMGRINCENGAKGIGKFLEKISAYIGFVFMVDAEGIYDTVAMLRKCSYLHLDTASPKTAKENCRLFEWLHTPAANGKPKKLWMNRIPSALFAKILEAFNESTVAHQFAFRFLGLNDFFNVLSNQFKLAKNQKTGEFLRLLRTGQGSSERFTLVRSSMNDDQFYKCSRENRWWTFDINEEEEKMDMCKLVLSMHMENGSS